MIKILRYNVPIGLNELLRETLYEEGHQSGIWKFYNNSKEKNGKQKLGNNIQFMSAIKTPWIGKTSIIKKIYAFSTESINFSRVLLALKVKCFQPNFAIFFMLFFTNSENATKSKFRQKRLNILSTLKFTGSHLAFYEWKVSFSLISPIIFFTRDEQTTRSELSLKKSFSIITSKVPDFILMTSLKCDKFAENFVYLSFLLIQFTEDDKLL